MTLRERLLRPFQGWAPFELHETNPQSIPSIIRRHRVALIVVMITFVSIAGLSWSYLTIPPVPPPRPILPIKPTYIATEEFQGRFRVFSFDAQAQTWLMIHSNEAAYYDCLASGSLNDDETINIVGITNHRIDDGYVFQLDVYTLPSLHKTTQILSDLQEATRYRDCELIICPERWVVVRTHDWLAVYQSTPEELQLYSQHHFAASALITDSVAVADIDGDGVLEIVVLANDAQHEQAGSIYIFQDYTLTTFTVLNIDAHLGMNLPLSVAAGNKFRHRNLQIGDLDGDGDPEICASGYRVEHNIIDPGSSYTDRYNMYLFIWNQQGDLLAENWIIENYYFGFGGFTFAIGDVDTSTPHKELVYFITVGTRKPGTIDYYYTYELSFCRGITVTPDWSLLLYGGRNLWIADADGDGENEIVIGGGAYRFFLEVMDEHAQTIWQRYSRDIGEGDVMAFVVG